MARLEVADNGPGIRPEDRGKIFEPYFSTKHGGTGLGLAIVSKIVADHNGYIRVRDNDPNGTRFVIELPVHPPTLQAGPERYEGIT
jgi:two-component system nitrogen regulation sensor histidine kinase NtrY